LNEKGMPVMQITPFFMNGGEIEVEKTFSDHFYID